MLVSIEHEQAYTHIVCVYPMYIHIQSANLENSHSKKILRCKLCYITYMLTSLYLMYFFVLQEFQTRGCLLGCWLNVWYSLN